jgi:hypothetical protein
MIVQRKIAGLLFMPVGSFLLVLCVCFVFSELHNAFFGGVIMFSVIFLPVFIIPSALLGVAYCLRWLDVRQFQNFHQWRKPWGLALLLSLICYHLVLYLLSSMDDTDGAAGALVYFVGVAEVLLSPVWITLSVMWYPWVSSRRVNTA